MPNFPHLFLVEAVRKLLKSVKNWTELLSYTLPLFMEHKQV